MAAAAVVCDTKQMLDPKTIQILSARFQDLGKTCHKHKAHLGWGWRQHLKQSVLVPDGYGVGQLLGRGSFGKVLVLEQKNEIDHAIKTMTFRQSMLKDWNALFRELYMHLWLQKNNHSIATMVAANAAYQHASFVLSKYDCNMQHRSTQTALHYLTYFTPVEIKAWKQSPQFVIKRSECIRMFKILFALKEEGILHGDVKPDQFLYGSGEIVLADFGCCGFLQPETAKAHQQLLFQNLGLDHLPKDVLDPKAGWISNDVLQFDPLLTRSCRNKKWSKSEQELLCKSMAWFDIWCLDLCLSRGGFSIWEDIDQPHELSTKPYVRLCPTLFPWKLEEILLSQCAGVQSSSIAKTWINERTCMMKDKRKEEDFFSFAFGGL